MPKHGVNDCLRILTVTDINVSEDELVWYNERKGSGFVRIGDTEVFFTDRRLTGLALYAY